MICLWLDQRLNTSGFGWFRWFRSKANKDEAPSLDSTASVSQVTKKLFRRKSLGCFGEKITQSPLVSPMNQHHCLPPLSPTQGNSFSKRSPEVQNSQGPSSMEATIVSDAGDQVRCGIQNETFGLEKNVIGETSSFRHQYNPDSVPLPHTEGTVPLFNPAQQPLALGICNRIFSNIGHIICKTNNPGYFCGWSSDQKPLPYPNMVVL
ncbi:hypothetical protein Chor_003326 [Crotalus horridus]